MEVLYLYRYDIIAQISYGRKLAEKLQPYARMIDLHGGHLVSHERTEEVNQALIDLINASESKISPHDWTNLPEKSSWWTSSRTSKTNNDRERTASFMFDILQKLHLSVLYLFGLFVMSYEYARRAVRSLKPVKVGASLT